MSLALPAEGSQAQSVQPRRHEIAVMVMPGQGSAAGSLNASQSATEPALAWMGSAVVLSGGLAAHLLSGGLGAVQQPSQSQPCSLPHSLHLASPG